MVVQFNYIVAIVGLLNVQYSDSLVFGTETSDNDLCKCVYGENNKISENINNYVDQKLQDLESNIMEKFEVIIGLQYNMRQYTDNITDVLSKSACQNIKQPEVMERLDKKLAEIESGLQNSITVKFQILENNRMKEINELVNTIKLLTATTDPLTKQMEKLTKIEPEIIKTLSGMESYLQNNVKANFQILEDKIEKIKELTNTTELLLATNTKKLTDQIELNSNTLSDSILTINRKLEVIENELQNNISAKFQSLEKETQSLNMITNNSQVSGNNTNEFKNYTNIQASFCNITVPKSVHTNQKIWSDSEKPEKDDLDVYMIDKTGCSYSALEEGRLQIAVRTILDGEVYRWREGVRAGGQLDLYVATERDAYAFYMGEEHNAVTTVYRGYDGVKEHLSTPGLLSPERYVWLHLTVEPGRVTLETCDGALNYSGPFAVDRGEQLWIGVKARPRSGSRWLHACPGAALSPRSTRPAAAAP